MHEWPLVLFTLIAQTVAGAFVILHLPPVYRRIDPDVKGKTALILIAAACVGTGISFFHLGQPFRSIFVFRNLAGSWLSREIAAQLLFLAGMSLVWVLEWKRPEQQTLHRFVSYATACCALFLVYCMSRIYMLPAIPAWNSVLTPLSFFATAAVLGPLTLLVITAAGFTRGGRMLHRHLLPVTAAGALARIFIWFVRAGTIPRTILHIMPEFTAIVVCIILIAVALPATRYTGIIRGRRSVSLLLIAAFIAEFISRAAFYSLHTGSGLGGM